MLVTCSIGRTSHQSLHQENGALVLPALQLICYLHEENKVKNKAPPLTFPNFFDFSAYLSQKVQVSQVQYFPDVVTFVRQLRNSRLQRYRRFLKGVPALNDKRSVRGKLSINPSSGFKR